MEQFIPFLPFLLEDAGCWLQPFLLSDVGLAFTARNDVNQAGDQSAGAHRGCEAGKLRELFRPERLVLAEGWPLWRFHM